MSGVKDKGRVGDGRGSKRGVGEGRKKWRRRRLRVRGWMRVGGGEKCDGKMKNESKKGGER